MTGKEVKYETAGDIKKDKRTVTFVNIEVTRVMWHLVNKWLTRKGMKLKCD